MNKRIAKKILDDFNRWYLSGGVYPGRWYTEKQFYEAHRRLGHPPVRVEYV